MRIMPLTPEQQHQEKLSHARWRVNFRRSLLEMHRGTGTTEQERLKREQELLGDLEEAMRELDKLEKARKK